MSELKRWLFRCTNCGATHNEKVKEVTYGIITHPTYYCFCGKNKVEGFPMLRQALWVDGKKG